MHTSYAGKYKIQVHHGDTDILLKELEWFDNVITNLGLDMLGTGFGGALMVGSGSTPESITDTAMEAYVASASSSSAVYLRNSTILPYYSAHQISYTFGIGAIQGTIREVGIGPSSTNLFSRALLKDYTGIPVELTLGGIDRLTVIYEFRQYVKLEDFEFQIEINGVTRNCVGRPSMFTSGVNGFEWIVQLGRLVGSNYGMGYNQSAFYSNGASPFIGVYTGNPLGSGYGPTAGDNLGNYVPGTYKRGFYRETNTSSGNLNITAFKVSNSNTWSGSGSTGNGGTWQFSLVPSVVKSQYHSFRIEGEYSWGRYAP